MIKFQWVTFSFHFISLLCSFILFCLKPFLQLKQFFTCQTEKMCVLSLGILAWGIVSCFFGGVFLGASFYCGIWVCVQFLRPTHTLFHPQLATKAQINCLFTEIIENISSWLSLWWGGHLYTTSTNKRSPQNTGVSHPRL